MCTKSLSFPLLHKDTPCSPASFGGLDLGSGKGKNVLLAFIPKIKADAAGERSSAIGREQTSARCFLGGKRSVGWVCYVCVRSTARQLTVTEGWPGVCMRALSRFQTPTGKRRPPPPGFTLEPWEALSVLFINLHLDGYFFSSPSAFPLINHSGTPSRSLHYSIKMDVERKQDKMPLP